jgi:menaquinone-specific isochorismate synthase
MPAIQYQLDQRPDHKDLHSFLLNCKQSIADERDYCIASISLTIEPLDLLAVLNSIVKPTQRHFYFERSGHQEAILAFDVALQLETEGKNRFTEAKQFIEHALTKTTQFGELDAPFSGAHFFCNFSFFDRSHDPDFPGASVFLPAWQISRFGNRYTVVANVLINQNLNPEAAVNQLWQTLRKIQAIKYEVANLSILQGTSFLQQQFVSHPDRYKTSVSAALKCIEDQQFHKIVLAQALDVTSPLPLDLVASLNNLRKRYPHCYIFSASNAHHSTFIGASPERLVSLHQRRLATAALAGSAPRGRTSTEDAQLAQALLASEKDQHEHQFVIHAIAQHLKNLGLTPQLATTRLLQLSNIQHLQTPIRAIVPSGVHLLDAVAEFHPTPAVAGAPRRSACEQIREFECFERSLYAAPIGWVDASGNGEFAVGIRSAILNGTRARLFAGAGIVAGSNPEKELAEVQLKLQALLTALVS